MGFEIVNRSSTGNLQCISRLFGLLVSLALLAASPSQAEGRPLALGLDLAVQPSFGIFGEDDVGSFVVNDMVDEYTTGIRIGFFATDRHEIQLAIDLSETEVCAHISGVGERCRYSDFEVYTVNYIYNVNAWERFVPYGVIGVGAYSNETGFADDDGPAISIGFGARYFPTDLGFYLGLDARALGFFGDDATTGNGVIGLAIGWVVDTSPILGN